MTHLPDVGQVNKLILWHFFHQKIRFFSLFDSLRHGIKELTAQNS